MAAYEEESEWELSKENVQPLRQGRKFSSLTAALQPQPDQQANVKEEKQKFEIELRTYTGDDPISVWYNYILWMEQNFPKGARSNLTQLLEQCVTQFKDEEKYKDDPRNLEIWLKFASLCSEPVEIYSFMFNNRIGSGLAAFYEAWAIECETLGNTQRADSLYRQGIERCAYPLGVLEKRHRDFQARVANGACGTQGGDTDQDGSGDRLHLAQLKGHGKMKKVGSVRTAMSKPAVLGAASSSRTTPNAQGPGFSIFVDSDKKEPQLPAQSGDWGTVPARGTVNRENERKAGKWTEAKIRSRSTSSMGAPPIASQPTFQIHKDEEDSLPAVTPRKVIPEVNQVLSARKPQKPTNPLQHLMAPAGDVKQVAAYCKHLVYVGNQEFSIEELRAAYLEKKQEQLHLKKLKDESEKVERELKAQRDEREKVERELKAQLEQLAAVKAQHEKMQAEQELQKMRATPPPAAIDVLTPASEIHQPRMQPSLPIQNNSSTDVPSVEVYSEEDSAQRPVQVGLVKPMIPTPQDSLVNTPNYSGFTSSEPRSSDPTPDGSQLNANRPSSYLSSHSGGGLCAPSPTINTREALKAVMGMFNQTFDNMAWGKTSKQDPPDTSVTYPARPAEIPSAKPFTVFVEEDANPLPKPDVPPPFTVFVEEDANKPSMPAAPPSDENRLSQSRQKGTDRRPELGRILQPRPGGQQPTLATETTGQAATPEEPDAKFLPQLEFSIALPEEDDVIMDDDVIVANRRESRACFDGVDDLTFAPGFCSTKNFGDMVRLLAKDTETDDVGTKQGVPFSVFIDEDEEKHKSVQPSQAKNMSAHSQFGLGSEEPEASLICQSSKAPAPNGVSAGFLTEYIQPLRGPDETRVVAGPRHSVGNLEGHMDDMTFAPGCSSTKHFNVNLAQMASTPFNPAGTAPAMQTLPVSFITGDTGRALAAEKLSTGSDHTLGAMMTTTHETSVANRTAATSQGHITAPMSMNQTEDSYGKKNLSPITECSDEDTTASHLQQSTAAGDITRDGHRPSPKRAIYQTIEEEEEVVEVENPPPKSHAFNQTCHEIDVTNFHIEEDVQDLLSQSIMVNPYSDPFDSELIDELLGNLDVPIEEHPNYHRMQTVMPTFKVKKPVILGDDTYTVMQHLGEGAFARVYTICRKGDRHENTKVIKVQTPACPWEFYIAQELHRRLKMEDLLVRSSIMSIDDAYFFNDGSCFVNELLPHGTLLDIVNVVRATGKSLPEPVLLYMCAEMLRILEAMMKVNIIHGDVKPDNFLFRGLPLHIENTKEALQSETECLRLIDFGRSIDMRMFPAGTSFGVCVETSGFQCIEMKTQRPWTYQTDMFGVVGTMHVLIFGEYMNVMHDGQKWKPTTRFKRWFKSQEVMKRVFDALLNVESCSQLPDVSALREQVEDAFIANAKYNSVIKDVDSSLHIDR